jgi:hypothetical protein
MTDCRNTVHVVQRQSNAAYTNNRLYLHNHADQYCLPSYIHYID